MKKIVWYVSGGGIAQAGPYTSQVEAYNSMRLTKDAREKQTKAGVFPFPLDIVVWPEEVNE